MKSIHCTIVFVLFTLQLTAQDLRAPAYPLITHDPYFSIWSFGDKLNESPTKHWTGRAHPLTGVVKVDGKAFNFIGQLPTLDEEIVPTAEGALYSIRYCKTKPDDSWIQPGYDDKLWEAGKAPSGKPSKFNPVVVNTIFDTEIYYRREFILTDTVFENLQLNISHDDNTEIYINGIKAYSCGPCNEIQYVKQPIAQAALKSLKKGRNILAVHCMNITRGCYMDAGLTDIHLPVTIEPAVQQSVALTATQTLYTFTAGAIKLKVTFTSPLLMNDLEVFSRPASYITFDLESNDNKPHDVQLLFGYTGVLSTNDPGQSVKISQERYKNLLVQSVGTVNQEILARQGDNLRIDWGFAYLAAHQDEQVKAAPHNFEDLFSMINNKPFSDSIKDSTCLAKESFIGLVLNFDQLKKKSTHLTVAYDDLYSIQYFGKNLRPWWRRHENMTAVNMLFQAEEDYNRVMTLCKKFDDGLVKDATAAGGKAYADLCELAYRQAVSGHKLVAKTKETFLFFSKENFSNGSIGTVDITYPSAPLFILYNTELMKGMQRFIFEYVESGRWKKEFAPHDIGTYPLANGQTYREDMPVEETGNMIILVAAIAKKEKNASFAKQHWATLTRWAEYLKKEGFDPANQLSTDDMAGHLARNTNLSIKAILALASYGKLAGQLKLVDVQKEYTTLAKAMGEKWINLAKDSNHFSLSFGLEGTWSQKYNLVWDKLLDLHIFPKEIADKEISFYKNQQQPYGLPLDGRKSYAKSDWIIWTATMANTKSDFNFFMQPVWKFAHETPNRIPLSDWHETTNGLAVGHRARTVVGAYFIKLLEAAFRQHR